MNAPRTGITAEDVRNARAAAGLTQTEAAAVVYAELRAWQRWEGSERAIHPALFELFQLKTGQLVLKK